MRILIIAPSIRGTKGGMSTVLEGHLTAPDIAKRHQLSHIPSHAYGNIFKKIGYAASCFYFLVFNQKKFDVVHLHVACHGSFYRKSFFLWISKACNKKTVLHLHGGDFDEFYLNATSIIKRYIRRTLQRSDAVIVLSNYWKTFVKEQFSQSLRVLTLTNGVNISSYQDCVKEPTVNFRLLFLGKMVDLKGVSDLVAAIDILINQQERRDLSFCLCGDGEVDRIRRYVLEKKLDKNVDVLGWKEREEIKILLKAADALVLPSYHEGLPMSIIEAMACGKVIIATDVGGIPDLVEHGVNGFLFKPGQIEVMARHIEQISTNLRLIGEIQQNNIKRASEKFNQTSVTERLSALYSTL